jgi:cobaltochelatase CobS
MTKKASPNKVKSTKTFKIGEVELPVREGDSTFVPKINEAFYFTEVSHCIAQDIVENKRVLLTGHCGTGKTSNPQQIAARINQPVTRINLNGQATIGDLVGFWSVKGGETVWIDGALPMAMKEGHWLILDEIDFAEPAILSILNGVLEKDAPLVLKEKGTEIVRPHKDFRIFATANTVGVMQEFRFLYQGANILNEAFIDRWRIYFVDYLEPDQEVDVLIKTLGLEEKRDKVEKGIRSAVEVANMARRAFEEETLSCTFSMRKLTDWVELMFKYKDPIKACNMAIKSKVSRVDGDAISSIIQRVLEDCEQD